MPFGDMMGPGCAGDGPGCCDDEEAPPCNGTFTVTLLANCGSISGSTVTLTFGSTTLTLTAPNVGSSQYRFTSTTVSGWSAGTVATLTISKSGFVTIVRTVTLQCSATTSTLILTRNFARFRLTGCRTGHYIAGTITISGTTGGDGTYDLPDDGSWLEVPITVEPTPVLTCTVSAHGYETFTGAFTACDNDMSLDVDTDHVCCTCDEYPMCKELTVDCELGSATLILGSEGGSSYNGFITATVTGIPATVSPGPIYINDCRVSNPPAEVSATFRLSYNCAGTLILSYFGCDNGSFCGIPGDSSDVYVAEDVDGEGFQYHYTNCDGDYIEELNLGGNRSAQVSVTVDSCEPAAFSAHGTLPGRYGGAFTINESCPGGGMMMARAPLPPPPAPIESPGLMAMAGNLAKSVAAHVADGGRKVSPEVQAERKAACFACDEFHDHARDRCRKCGCTAMNTKRSWASSVCPDTPPRWTAV